MKAPARSVPIIWNGIGYERDPLIVRWRNIGGRLEDVPRLPAWAIRRFLTYVWDDKAHLEIHWKYPYSGVGSIIDHFVRAAMKRPSLRPLLVQLKLEGKI